MNTLAAGIRENYQRVQERVANAALGSGRKPQDVKVVVVSKLQPLPVLQAAVEAGIRIFGENYPEEGARKMAALGVDADLEWHMIGHIQSRKAGVVVGSYHFIHSIDSVHLAKKLDGKLAVEGKTLPALLELNVSGEESKQGFPAWNPSLLEGLLDQVHAILNMKHLKIFGLMTMPPFFSQAELSRPFFKQLVKVKDYLSRSFPESALLELSMGTTQDYAVAVEEGATYVRIGQAILGERTKNI